MTTTQRLTTLLACAFPLLTSAPSIANGNFDPLQPGFSGAIAVNVGVAGGSSQFNTDDDNATTKDLTNNGDSYVSAAPMILGRLQYSFGDTAVFIGNSPDQIAEAQFQAELGVVRRLYADNTLTVALFGNVPSVDETWEDPYLTGVDRDTSEQTVMGGRVALDLNVPIPVSVSYAIADSEIDDDYIGTSLTLSTSERSLLKRDSVFQRATLDVSIPVFANLNLTPGVQYTVRDADGSAQSHQDKAVQLAISSSLRRHSFTATFRASQTEYDEVNPVFDRKRDSDNVGIFAVYNYMGLFSWQNAMFNLMAGYSESDSDITFYDTETFFVATGVGFRF
ncbi:DUF2860 family protein [Vibrio hepatarius]|uniref:DUF2860 family protein n=1 Tax=Vibrio hepatarius TaxID=171383 RepID=UPI00142D1FFD|nr:DUF2860 family protein [Vibrio hepatarius]NIY83876.1 DUF2860 domain-containing protein [Vibrio hepatarius]NVJ54952.1 DUF2860 domain-containing protein [Vibrionaceae bacterium]